MLFVPRMAQLLTLLLHAPITRHFDAEDARSIEEQLKVFIISCNAHASPHISALFIQLQLLAVHIVEDFM